MSGEKRFNVPSIEEMEALEFQQRTDVPKSHFVRNSGTSSTSSSSKVGLPNATNEQTNSKDAVPTSTSARNPTTSRNVGPSAASSRFQEHFSKLTESVKFSEIQKDLDQMPTEIPPEFKEALPAKPQPTNSNSLLVNPRQRGNQLLKSINNVPFEYADIIPDYVMGRTTCALFLSPEEAGRYVEMYKILENKPPDILMKRQEADPYSKLIDAMTSVKSINRNDAIVLLNEFGSIENILKASEDELSDCSGVGPLKAMKLRAVLHANFVKSGKR